MVLLSLLAGCAQGEQRDNRIGAGVLNRNVQSAHEAQFPFSAPREAITVIGRVMEYHGGEWQLISENCFTIGEERDHLDRLAGFLTVTVSEDSSISMQTSCYETEVSWQTAKAEGEFEGLSRVYTFLEEDRTIPLNEPIPAAILAFGEQTVVRTFTVTDAYASPQELEGYTLARAITVEFADREP